MGSYKREGKAALLQVVPRNRKANQALLTQTKSNVMFDADLTNNPNTALTAGTAASLVFALKTGAGSGTESLRSVAAVATTAPYQLKIAHSTSRVSGLRYTSGNILGADIVVDRHNMSFLKNIPLTTLGIADPNFAVNYGASLTVSLPRVGADTPSTQLIMDNILRMLVILNPSTNAGLTKFLNGEL